MRTPRCHCLARHPTGGRRRLNAWRWLHWRRSGRRWRGRRGGRRARGSRGWRGGRYRTGSDRRRGRIRRRRVQRSTTGVGGWRHIGLAGRRGRWRGRRGLGLGLGGTRLRRGVRWIDGSRPSRRTRGRAAGIGALGLGVCGLSGRGAGLRRRLRSVGGRSRTAVTPRRGDSNHVGQGKYGDDGARPRSLTDDARLVHAAKETLIAAARTAGIEGQGSVLAFVNSQVPVQRAHESPLRTSELDDRMKTNASGPA